MIGALQCVAHVLGHGTGHHQHIGVARRGNKPDAEALDIVVGIVKGMDLKLASITGASVDFAYRETAAETPPRRTADGRGEFFYRCVIQRRRLSQ